MTQEEKQLLLKDLCAWLPYDPFIKIGENPNVFKLSQRVRWICSYGEVENMFDEVKPYLRPMSSMTDEERKEYKSFIFTRYHEWDGHGTSTDYVETDDVERYFTWLNKKGFDYRGLIPMGLALEAPEGMYKTK